MSFTLNRALPFIFVAASGSMTGSVSEHVALGQAPMSGSIPVTMAFDQSPLQVVLTPGQTTIPVSVAGSVAPPTFTAITGPVPVGNEKSMFSLVNAAGSSSVVRVLSVYIINRQSVSVTGVTGVFDICRCSDHTGGTSVVPMSVDTDDVLSGVTCATGAVVSDTTNPLWSIEWSTDEWVGSKSNKDNAEGEDHGLQALFPVWTTPVGGKPLVVRAGQGISVKFSTNSSIGTFDIRVIFTQGAT